MTHHPLSSLSSILFPAITASLSHQAATYVIWPLRLPLHHITVQVEASKAKTKKNKTEIEKSEKRGSQIFLCVSFVLMNRENKKQAEQV